MLSLWGEGLLVFVALASAVLAWQARSRERLLADRLAARERGGHFLGESPEPGEILKHAYAAASEIVPVTRFDLYRIDPDGQVEEAWTLAPDESGKMAPSLDPGNTWVGNKVDARRMRDLSATETERSFAPRDLLAGGSVRRLRLPLYSGDRLVAHLDLGSSAPIDEERKAEIRALLGPLTASLHASRNWAVAVTDELSGLSSRRYFEARLAEEWSRCDRYETPLSIACFDLDRFKTVNDTLGHAAGDQVIRRFGEIVRSVVRASDLACRLGGEEFAALLPNTAASSARPVAERIRRALERERFEMDGKDFWVTVSAGVADASSSSGLDARKLLARADQALYAAKAGGRNRVRVWTDKLGREGARPRPQEPAPAKH
ncbi:MAG: GGDEF domain-containing protein [Acidobacteriota bacterium]